MELGNLERIEDLRLVWKNEAYDFTPWLAEEDNMNILENMIGIDISEGIREEILDNMKLIRRVIKCYHQRKEA